MAADGRWPGARALQDTRRRAADCLTRRASAPEGSEADARGPSEWQRRMLGWRVWLRTDVGSETATCDKAFETVGGLRRHERAALWPIGCCGVRS